jgi:UPF0716 protein FxsA
VTLFRLFALFTLVPAAELALLIYVGSRIGTAETIALVIGTAALGAYLVRREGIGVMARLQGELGRGAFPAEELLDGALVLLSGAFLITPGFMTDVVGFTMVAPATRQVWKSVLVRYVRARIRSARVEPF